MARQLERFGLVQTIRALSLLHGQTCRRDILVAVDFLLQKYDRGLMAQGFEPLGLRAKLHDTNHIIQKEIQKKKRKKQKGQEETQDWAVKDLEDFKLGDLSIFCKQLLSETKKEIAALEETEHSSLRMEIWENIQHVLAGPHTEVDLEPLLKTLVTLKQKMVLESKEGDKATTTAATAATAATATTAATTATAATATSTAAAASATAANDDVDGNVLDEEDDMDEEEIHLDILEKFRLKREMGTEEELNLEVLEDDTDSDENIVLSQLAIGHHDSQAVVDSEAKKTEG